MENDKYVKMCIIESMDKHYQRFNYKLKKLVQDLPPSEQKTKLIEGIIEYSKRINMHLSKMEWDLTEVQCEVGRLTRENTYIKRRLLDSIKTNEQTTEILGICLQHRN